MDEDRVICPACHANNFAGSLQCWQCHKSLANSSPTTAPPQVLYPSRRGEKAASALAPNTAAALGLIFPYIGLPVGMIFLMLEEPRRVRLGWITIGWSVAGAVINIIIGIISLALLLPTLSGYLPHNGAGGTSIPNTSGIDSGQ